MTSVINSQTLKMISEVESFLYSDKKGMPEKGQRIQKLKCILTNNNKDENKSHNQNLPSRLGL